MKMLLHICFMYRFLYFGLNITIAWEYKCHTKILYFQSQQSLSMMSVVILIIYCQKVRQDETNTIMLLKNQ